MHSKSLWRCVLLLATITLGPLATAAEQQSSESGRGSVEVRFLANEGFLLRTQDVSVLIDAFISQPYSVYGAVPDEALQEMFAGGAPYHRTRLALVSHIHQDHFQPEVAALFLQSRPEVLLVSSPQVVEAISQAPVTKQTNNNENKSTVAILPAIGETVLYEMENVQVEFLRLAHGSNQYASIENLGHIIHLNGQLILHIGDARMDPQLFEPYDLASRNLDVALIPYWFFLEEAGQEILQKHLRARYRVAVHIPVKELEDIVVKMQANYPNVKIFRKPLQFSRY